jgi:hypothetical protein
MEKNVDLKEVHKKFKFWIWLKFQQIIWAGEIYVQQMQS